MFSQRRNIAFAWLFVLVLTGCQSELPRSRVEIAEGWQFKAVDADTWHTANVPGVVHTDLLEHGLIPDPFIGTNEDSVQWVEEKQWEYQTIFQLSEEELESAEIEIVFEGLDTYAEVYLNGKSILAANNMFRQWRVNVSEALHIGENELRVVFTSPIEEKKSRLQQLSYSLPAGSETGEWQVSPFTRKAAYQFGWDFAPRLVTMGIWQPVYLDFWSKARISDVNFMANNITDQEANYTAHLTLYAEKDNLSCTVKVLDNEKEIFLTKGYNAVAIDFTIAEPKLWWPNGLGEAHLYDIPVQVLSGGQVIDSLNQRLGIRTIELVQAFDSTGRSFYFKVNGTKVFAKGANWSPLSSFPSAVADSTYRNRNKAVKDANMNMLRVWGGGIYERDLFYDLCDENGILVWQDFMFANSMYPGDDEFIDNVKEEVKQQVIRLRSHPSLAIWNGNNEIDVAWKNWGWQKQYGYSEEDSAKIKGDYERLFQQIIPAIIDTYDPSINYTHTSPLSNWGKPENFNSGSMHYWGVWHGGDSFEAYKTKVGRFMAEYGFQSFPVEQTLAFYAGENEFDLDSPSAHQKSYVGNKMITREIDKNFGNSNSISSFLQKSQQTQALAYKIAIEAHRVNKTTCGGTLFWQLNDCWPGPSWSVIDYFGRKKQAFAVVKDRYKPVILVVESQGNDFSISVVNDHLTGVDAELKLELFKANNYRLVVTSKPIDIEANSVKNIYRSDIRKLLDGMPKDEVYLKLTLFTDDETLDIEKFYFVKPKDYKGEVDLVGVE